MKKKFFTVLILLTVIGGTIFGQTVNDHLDRGATFMEQKEFDKAIAEFTNAIRLAPNDASSYAMRCSAYFWKGDFECSIADGETALRLDPKLISTRFLIYNLTDAYQKQGEFYLDKNDLDKAIASFTNAIKYSPDYNILYIARGFTYENKKDFDRAIADYTQAIRLNPNEVVAYINRGNTYYKKKDYDRAIADFEAALRIDPNDSDAKEGLAAARKARGR